jgi:hypothetical protein
MGEDETILRLYEEERTHARFHESQRETCANLLAGISAGLIGLITFDGNLEPIDFLPALFIACIGIYGIVFMLKLTERRKLHFNRAYAILSRLERTFDGKPVREFMREADTLTKREYPVTFRVSLVSVWVAYSIIIIAIGVALMVMTIPADMPATLMQRLRL